MGIVRFITFAVVICNRKVSEVVKNKLKKCMNGILVTVLSFIRYRAVYGCGRLAKTGAFHRTVIIFRPACAIHKDVLEGEKRTRPMSRGICSKNMTDEKEKSRTGYGNEFKDTWNSDIRSMEV